MARSKQKLPTSFIEPPYRWFPARANGSGQFTNISNDFMVLLGINDTALDSTSDQVSIVAPDGLIVDSLQNIAFGTPANAMVTGLLRKMLLPPGYTITTLAGVGLSLVQCDSLKDALLIR